MNSLYKYYRWLVPGFFVLMVGVNYLSTSAVIFPATQAEISDKYVNLLAPAGFTFSIWAVIYIGMLAVILIDFLKIKDDRLVFSYRTSIQARMVEWMSLNILWIISWSYEYLLVSLIAILLYTNSILKLVAIISRTPVLRQQTWQLKLPMGLHAGWLLVASFANLTTYLVSRGLSGTSFWGMIWASAAMVIILAVVTFYYAKYGNQAIMIPALWTLFGIFMKHSPFSDFAYKEGIIMYLSAFLFVIGVVVYLSLFRLQKEQKNR